MSILHLCSELGSIILGKLRYKPLCSGNLSLIKPKIESRLNPNKPTLYILMVWLLTFSAVKYHVVLLVLCSMTLHHSMVQPCILSLEIVGMRRMLILVIKRGKCDIMTGMTSVSEPLFISISPSPLLLLPSSSLSLPLSLPLFPPPSSPLPPPSPPLLSPPPLFPPLSLPSLPLPSPPLPPSCPPSKGLFS